jgi:hypothetical protein
MKKNVVIIALLIVGIIFSLPSCQKSDIATPENGKDGNTLISGAGIPSNSIGKVGDFFVDTVGKVMWGPKNITNWGAGIALVGPTGLPGKTIMSGTGTPTLAVGTAGDFYIDMTAKKMYGPKTTSGWGVPTTLVGPTGATGAMGATGATGAAGTPAQVIYSPWITSPFNSRDTTIDGTCLKIRHLTAPSLSTSILNQGVMITYMRVGTIGPYALPYTSDAGGATNTVNCIYNLQKILVYRHTFNTCRFNSGIPESYPGQPVLINLPQSLEYRYVFIPGLINSAKSGIQSEQQDLHHVILPGQTNAVDIASMPYAQVCNLLGIME